MDEEITALQKNVTWEKCTLSNGKKTVGCKWVFSVKYHADGTIERYKARPVAKIDTIRVLFSITANKDWPLYQFDVKNVFLYGEIEKEVYMKLPPRFSDEYNQGERCKLKKALYGLKQSPRAWFGRLTAALKKFGYKQSNSNHTLFLWKKGDQITSCYLY